MRVVPWGVTPVAVTDDEVCTGLDDCVGERDRVAAPLVQVRLRPRSDVRVGRPFRAGVHVHDDDIGAPP